MRIATVTAYAVKDEAPYVMSGSLTQGELLPGSDYRRFGPHRHLYSTRSQAALVRVATEDGTVGWGEAQSPVGTEVILTIIAEILGPAVAGQDATATTARHRDMYETNRVRGQIGGYQQDAIAGLDAALWDVRGRATGTSVAELLGGRLRDRLPAYVTGLRANTRQDRCREAADWVAAGFGVKPCLGLGVKADAKEVESLRSAMGDDAWLALDGLWAYTLPEATRLGRTLEQCGVAFFESPMPPEDIAGHRRLRDALDVPVAVGEPLRTRHQFLPWLTGDALDVAQPDLMRNGITETTAIATLAEAFHRPVALHTGVATAVGMAATWQVAAALPGFAIQEHQPVMAERFGSLSETPLQVADGMLKVPTGPGIGIEIDRDRVESLSSASVTVTA